jgi:hypothetical protein
LYYSRFEKKNICIIWSDLKFKIIVFLKKRLILHKIIIFRLNRSFGSAGFNYKHRDICSACSSYKLTQIRRNIFIALLEINGHILIGHVLIYIYICRIILSSTKIVIYFSMFTQVYLFLICTCIMFIPICNYVYFKFDYNYLLWFKDIGNAGRI